MNHLFTKSKVWLAGISLFVLAFAAGNYSAMAQTVTELVVPMYMGGKTAASANNARTPFAACFQITGLNPSTAYDVRSQIGLVTEAATVYGAGNVWNGSAFSGNSVLNAFTTDAAGNSGPFWIFYQPTGNGTRFGPGQQHTLRMSWTVSGGTFPASAMFAGSKVITALDIATTAMTPETTDDGAYIKGSANPLTNGKYVLLFDNVNGIGDPLYSFQIRDGITTNPTQSQLNTEINDIYMQAGTSAVGDYPAIVPIGANNPNGVRRIESRNTDNTIYGFNTDADGIWPSGANTTNMARLDIRYITMSDAPLAPVGVPTVTTATTTNITHNSATSGGNVTATGGSAITARGVCWATTPNPTLANNYTVEPGGLGAFTSQITNLNPTTIYYVRAYATNANGTAYGNQETFTTLTAPYPPVADFVASSTSITIGQTVNFTDLSTNGPTSWSWSFVGGIPPSSSAQNPTGILYSYAGQYTVCLTATNQHGSNTLCKDAYITVNAPVDAQIVITEIMYNPPEAGTDSLEFIELYNNGTQAVDLEGFYFSDGVVFTFPSYVLAPGAYMLTAVNSTAIQNTFGVPSLQWTSGALNNAGELIRLKDKFGYTVDSVWYDDVLPWDTLADGWGPSLTLCNPNLDNSIAENWKASTEFAAVNANGDTIWATPGTGCIIPEPPIANFSGTPTQLYPGETVVFTDLSLGTGITAWEWAFEGGTPAQYSGQIPPPITYAVLGIYDVTLTVTNQWGTDTKVRSDYIQVVTNPGIDNPGQGGLLVSPNPSTGIIFIDIPKGTYTLEIFSLLGEKVFAQQISKARTQSDLGHLNKGVYLLRFTSLDGQRATQKLILK